MFLSADNLIGPYIVAPDLDPNCLTLVEFIKQHASKSYTHADGLFYYIFRRGGYSDWRRGFFQRGLQTCEEIQET